jgi:hypothetical protein
MTNANARKTHCKRGHEFTEVNTYIVDGMRRCRTCDRDRKRRSRGWSTWNIQTVPYPLSNVWNADDP